MGKSEIQLVWVPILIVLHCALNIGLPQQTIGQVKDSLNVPPGVSYVRAPEVENQQARTALKELFETQPHNIFTFLGKKTGADELTLVGSILWQRIKVNLGISDSGFQKVGIRIPLAEDLVVTMPTIGLRNNDERRKFSEYFSRAVKLSPEFKIRNLNTDEMSLIWMFISWDITEPIFVVEDANHKLVIDFEKGHSLIRWIEDIKEPCFVAADAEGRKTPCFCLVNGRFVLSDTCGHKEEQPSLALSALTDGEKKVFEVISIRLYLPDAELRKRLGDDVTPLTNYIKEFEKAASAFWKEAPQQEAPGLLIVVAIKPGKKARVWCEAVEGKIAPELQQKCEQELGKVATIEVKHAPMAFAIEGRLWGRQVKEFPEIPKVWSDAVKQADQALMIDDLLKVIWPD